MTEKKKEEKKIKRAGILTLLSHHFNEKKVYGVTVNKESMYMMITELGFEIYFANKKVVNHEEVLDKVELRHSFTWSDFESAEVDKFALATLYKFNTGFTLKVDASGDLTKKLKENNVSVTILKRKWFNKILGFRSKKKWKMVTAIIGYLLIIAFIGNLFNGGNNKEVSQPMKEESKQIKNDTAAVPVVKEEPQKKLSLQEKIKQDINKKLGSKTNNKTKRIAKLEANDHMGTEKQGDKIVLITLAGDENLTAKLTIKGMLMDSNKVFQSIFKNNEVEEVTIFWQYPMTDAYGKSKDENVIKISLTKETFKKIEWENFYYNNYKTIADQFWMHPALSNELNK
ncbi:hypothetical protein [Bacillus sp. UNC438CL73TsuS30]|uniref:hypothetical protein n=1 Tax=Bacillus sp. UNC438CL73TsuS30 TaxID=1340434 RepID=UPI00047EA5F5|nr:hypothetical protein [Bacillus sp. UNC438CL73TsuS30]